MRLTSALLAGVLVCLLALRCSAQPGLYTFCFTSVQSNPTSPHLPWAVSLSGTLQLSGALTYGQWVGYIQSYFPQSQWLQGYAVVNATGTRVIYYGAGQSQTLSITGVAAPSSYNGNDNILASTPPYFDNLAHSLTFTLSGQPQFVQGVLNTQFDVAGNLKYSNLNNYTFPLNNGAGVWESDDPPNDGDANVVTSTFALTPSSSWSASVTCANTVSQPTVSSAVSAQYSATISWPFCYTFTGGGNFASVNGQVWNIVAYGTLTTTAYQGTGAMTGLPMYMATGVSGQRSYSNAGTGISTTVNFAGLGGVNAQQAINYNDDQFDFLYTYYGDFSNIADNVFFPSYPYFDQYGVNLIGNGWYGNEDQNNLTTNALRLFVDPNSFSLDEWATDFVAGYWYFTYDGASIFTNVSSTSPSALSAQCSPTYGASTVFQFCYYVDGTNQSPAFFSYAYGNFIANGPAQREGRMAYTLQSIQGVRVFTNGVASGSPRSASGIVYLEWVQSDLGLATGGFINNNLVYTTQPYIDQQGFIYSVANAPVFPNGAFNFNYGSSYGIAGLTDVYVATTQVGGVTAGAYLYEEGVYNYTLSAPSPIYSNAPSAWGFNYQPGSAPPSASLCGSSNPNIVPITTTSYSFCYLMQGADGGGWQTHVSGVLTVYNELISVNGRSAYTVINATGTRTFQNQSGSWVTAITGISNTNQGAYGWIYNNLLYSTAPYLDSYGVLLSFTGSAYTASGAVQGDGFNVINLFYWYAYQEEYYNSASFSVYGDVVGTFGLSNDGGSSGLATGSSNLLQAATSSSGYGGCGWNGQSFANQQTSYAFCYVVQNTLATSPYLPFTVLTQGVFTVYSNSLSTGYLQQNVELPGYLIAAASGTRSVWFAGQPVQNQSISLAPPGTYNANDNIMQQMAPWFLSYHSVAFVTSSPAIYATGTVPFGSGSLSYISLNNWTSPAPANLGGGGPGITESDLPISDGNVAVLTSAINIVPGSTPSCPVMSASLVPSVSSSQASQYASTVQYAFCYTLTGVDNLGTNWTIATTGTLTTAGYTGTTVSGQSAVVVLNAAGSRSVTLGNGTSITTQITGAGGFYSYQFVAEAFSYQQYSTYFATNNILYLSYPYFDSYGLALQGATSFREPNYGDGSTGNSALKLFIDPATYDMSEWIVDWGLNVYYVGEAGTLQVSPVSSVGSSGLSTFYAQCSPNYGALASYNFCYSIARQSYYVYAYGTFTAKGPVNRQGRQAYTLQSMNGVRSYVNLSTGVTSTNNIIDLQYINQDEGYGGGYGLTFWTINDNIVYASAPYLDEDGLLFSTFSTPNLPMFPQGAGVTNDILLSVNQTFPYGSGLGLTEAGVGSESTYTDLPSLQTIGSNFQFSYSQSSSVATSSQCSASSGANTAFKYPNVLTYSFCYVISNASQGFTVSSSGIFQVYQTAVSSTLQYPNATAYPMASIMGYRQYQDNLGNNSYVTITGLGSSEAAHVGWDYDQLFYLNANSWDSYGLLYGFSGTAMSPYGPVNGDAASPVINIFNDGVNGFQEEGWTGGFNAAYDVTFGVFNFSQDGGASYYSGSLLRSGCGYNGSIPAGFGPTSSNNGGGGGGSGLSGGAIAGIVIGSVVGALLICLFCLFFVLRAMGGKQEKQPQSTSRPVTTTGFVPHEESQVETSHVEMVADTTGSEA